MDIIGRYIFRQTAGALAMILITLTLIIWMTTALQKLSLMTAQGQSFFTFLSMTFLVMPNLIAVVAPVALLISSLHTLNRLSGDSELIVLSASGATVWRVLKPYLVLAVLVAAAIWTTNAWLTPQAMRTLRELLIQVRSDVVGSALQAGQFAHPEAGFTVHFRARDDATNELLSLVIDDERDPKQSMTYLAERARFVKQDGNRMLLVMRNGNIHRKNPKEHDTHIVTFDSYVFDLSHFGPKEGATDYKPRERFLHELLWPDPNDVYFKQNAGKMRSELHDRLSNPLYAFLFVLLVGVHLGYPRTTRDSRLQSIFAAFGVAAALRTVGLVGVNMLAKNPAAVFIVWGVPIVGILATAVMAHYEIKPLALPTLQLPSWLRPKAKPKKAA